MSEEFEMKEQAELKALEDPAVANQIDEAEIEDSETPLDKNVKLMSPMRMVLRRFFRSKLSIAGIIMLVALIVYLCFVPLVVDNGPEPAENY